MDDKTSILIVDDEQVGRETLEDLLLTQGFNLTFASSGAEALQKVAELNPDLILLDIMMPGMNGLEVCQRLRAEEKWQHIPIVLVTALDSKNDLVRGLDSGADDFLSKPVSGLELRARVRSMLRIKHQYDSLRKKGRELETSLHLNRKFSQVFAQHLEALEVLHEAGLHLMSNLDTDSVLNLILQTALDLIPEATGSIMHFLAGEDGPLLPVVFSPQDNAKIVYPCVGVEEIVQQAIETQAAIFVPDVALAANCAKFELPNMRSLLVTPLAGEQQPLGTISVYSSEVDVFEEDHQHILSILAGQAAVAITKARFLKDREQAREREKQTIRQLFQRFVGPTVVDRLVDDRDHLALGGKRQEISVLFADIRGFTAFGENLAPERLVGVLNQYLALAVEAILAEEGMLDKFMGDAVMAVFNAPLAQPDHTIRAVRAALAVQQAVAKYNMSLRDHPPLNFGVGVHVGQAVVGNIGTTRQMNYTAIGDTVNLAKRLQECAKGGQIILSQEIYETVNDHVAAKYLGSLIVKGRLEEVRAYLPLACADFENPP